MSGNESDSSEDEWVTSTLPTTTPPTPTERRINQVTPRKTMSSSLRTNTPHSPIRNNSPITTINRTTTPITLIRSTVSPATIRTIRAALPSHSNSSTTTTSTAASSSSSSPEKLQKQTTTAYITPEDLDHFCQNLDSQGFVRKLVETYKNAETYLQIREIETQKLTIDARLCEHLIECPDPGAFVLNIDMDDIFVTLETTDIYIYKD
ncbi:hypothetical protein BDC45DRAFT_538181 [Circinella umbellata]|nr:hypothetical protein BDC45DRAFT_538181 [Circinella umbellata]